MSQVDAEDEETSNIAPNTLVEDESDSEIEHEDEDQDEVINAGDADGLVEFIEERNEPVFQADIIQRLAIGYMFFKKFGAPENHQEWRDKKIRPKIRKAFVMHDDADLETDKGKALEAQRMDVIHAHVSMINYSLKHSYLYQRWKNVIFVDIKVYKCM